MEYRELKPPSSATQLVESLWRFQVDALPANASAHVIVPDGAVSLSYVFIPNHEPFVGLTGPSVKAHRAPLMTGAVYAGIRLRPGAAGSVLKSDITKFRDKFGPNSQPPSLIAEAMRSCVPPSASADDQLAMLRAAAIEIARLVDPLDDVVCGYAHTIAQSQGDISLRAAAETIDLSASQLRKRFKYQCGLTAKEFARLRRVRNACIDLVLGRANGRADIASASGFADQSHMSREIKDVFGHSTNLVEDYLRQISHTTLVIDEG